MKISVDQSSDKYRGEWQPTTAYYEGDMVIHNGVLNVAVTDFLSTGTFDQADWTEVSCGGGPVIDPEGTTIVAFYKLVEDYTGPCMKVRRGSDDATLDIPFSGNDVDESVLNTFRGGSDVYLDTWYDQSGSSNDWTQPILADQHPLSISGVLNKVNSKLATVAGLGSGYRIISPVFSLASIIDIYTVAKPIIDRGLFIGTASNSNYYGMTQYNSPSSTYGTNINTIGDTRVNGVLLPPPVSRIDMHDATIDIVSVVSMLRMEKAQSTIFRTGYSSDTPYPPVDNQQAIVIYDKDTSTDLASIESALMTAFGVI